MRRWPGRSSVIDKLTVCTDVLPRARAPRSRREVRGPHGRICALPAPAHRLIRALWRGFIHSETLWRPRAPAQFDPRISSPEQGGERIATALMFLSTPEEGGETVRRQPGAAPSQHVQPTPAAPPPPPSHAGQESGAFLAQPPGLRRRSSQTCPGSTRPRKAGRSAPARAWP